MMQSYERIRPSLWYLVLYCTSVSGALSFERPFGNNPVLLLCSTGVLFLLCALLILARLSQVVRAFQLVSGLVLTFLGNVAERPANQDIAFFGFVLVIYGMCILMPASGSELRSSLKRRVRSPNVSDMHQQEDSGHGKHS